MSLTKGKNWLGWMAATLAILALTFAWIDGGREPLREISQPVAVPEQNK